MNLSQLVGDLENEVPSGLNPTVQVLNEEGDVYDIREVEYDPTNGVMYVKVEYST